MVKNKDNDQKNYLAGGRKMCNLFLLYLTDSINFIKNSTRDEGAGRVLYVRHLKEKWYLIDGGISKIQF